MSKTIRREQCPKCHECGNDSSRNNLVTYLADDGTDKQRCVAGCDITELKTTGWDIEYGQPRLSHITIPIQLLDGEYKDYRGLRADTCEEYIYKIGFDGNPIANVKYLDESNSAQKVRLSNKVFPWHNYNEKLQLFGQDLFDPVCTNSSEVLIITEGFEDTITIYQETGYPAVSIIRGAQSARKDIEDNIDFVLKFKKVVLFFDNDAAGIEAQQKVSQLITKDKLLIVSNDRKYKDANEYINRDVPEREELVRLLHETIENIPKGIIFANRLDKNRLLEVEKEGYQLPWKGLNDMLKGLRKGKLVLVGGGSNIGKTPILREIGFHLFKTYPELKIANFYLEENQKDSPLSYIAMDKNILIDDFSDDPLKYMNLNDFNQAYESLNTDRLAFIDSTEDFGINEFFNSIEYLISKKNYAIIILDHLSFLFTNTQSRDGERKDIDRCMHKLAQICKKTGVIVIASCHLSNPSEGKDWEDGREVRQKDFRGSGSIRQYPDIMIGIERNMRNQGTKDQSIIRVIKNRGRGNHIGIASRLVFKENTGRLEDLSTVFGVPNA